MSITFLYSSVALDGKPRTRRLSNRFCGLVPLQHLFYMIALLISSPPVALAESYPGETAKLQQFRACLAEMKRLPEEPDLKPEIIQRLRKKAAECGAMEEEHKRRIQLSKSQHSSAASDSEATDCVELFQNSTNRISLKNICNSKIHVFYTSKRSCSSECDDPILPGKSVATPIPASDTVTLKACFGEQVPWPNPKSSRSYVCRDRVVYGP